MSLYQQGVSWGKCPSQWKGQSELLSSGLVGLFILVPFSLLQLTDAAVPVTEKKDGPALRNVLEMPGFRNTQI